jgi:hypothetical protein
MRGAVLFVMLLLVDVLRRCFGRSALVRLFGLIMLSLGVTRLSTRAGRFTAGGQCSRHGELVHMRTAAVSGPGHWTPADHELSIPGQWQLRFRLSVSRFEV